MRYTVFAAGTALALALSPVTASADNHSAAIAAAVANANRPEADRARDGDRKPAAIVEFAGVKPGMTIVEYAPGGGYYTRILAGAVGPTGHVYALMPAAFADRPGGLDRINEVAAAMGNVTVMAVDFTNFTLPQPADLAWTTENYHDFNNGPAGNIDKINAGAFAALKSGGLYFVEDHSAPGTGTSATSTIHRIDPEAVKQQVTGAGFAFEAESDILVNANDPLDINPREVTDGVSTKFALRFRKPG